MEEKHKIQCNTQFMMMGITIRYSDAMVRNGSREYGLSDDECIERIWIREYEFGSAGWSGGEWIWVGVDLVWNRMPSMMRRSKV
jgi:hypothetical protein